MGGTGRGNASYADLPRVEVKFWGYIVAGNDTVTFEDDRTLTQTITLRGTAAKVVSLGEGARFTLFLSLGRGQLSHWLSSYRIPSVFFRLSVV
ncbi:hypothetical protein Lepto7375DRAFT_7786 [Leptolyngbya sp. PCC 7375]|nr:hypothetical protein Lepto7375DRAFT_7786 [Leptolyngbya sp. PCC 7375]